MKCAILFLTASLLLVAEATSPRIIHKVDPTYSDAARDARVSGTVKLALTIDSSGVPSWIEVVRPLGYGLDESAIQAVSQWRFQPATENGKPVARDCEVEVNFHVINSPAPRASAVQYRGGSPAGLVFHRL